MLIEERYEVRKLELPIDIVTLEYRSLISLERYSRHFFRSQIEKSPSGVISR